jgi:hypothetical protein
MNKVVVSAIGGIFFTAGVALATPPGPGQHFDCTDGGDTSCADDDTGCVSDTFAHLQCSKMIGQAFAKARVKGMKCHIKQAEMRFKGASVEGAGSSEENCERNEGNSAKSKLDERLADVAAGGTCAQVQLDNAALEEEEIFGAGPDSLDAKNVSIFCDSSSGVAIGDDDTGWVAATEDMLKCEITVAKSLSRLVKSGIKCHERMNSKFFNGRDFNEEICEMTDPVSTKGALAKFNKVRDRLALLGICPPCLDSTTLDALAAEAINELDTENELTYPCGL